MRAGKRSIIGSQRTNLLLHLKLLWQHADILLKNPAERLEDLRRSSLVEIELLAKAPAQLSSVPGRALPGAIANPSPLRQTDVVAPKPKPKPSATPFAAPIPSSSSDSLSSLEIDGESGGSDTVSRLEAAARNTNVGTSSSDDIGVGSDALSKIAFVTPSFAPPSETSAGSASTGSEEMPGSFPSETPREESALSPTRG